MELDELKKLYKIFIQGIDLGPQARDKLLDQECRGDQKLRQQALLLLSSESKETP